MPAEAYILEKPEPFRSILLHLQMVIERNIPTADLQYKYKIPFYYLDKKPFCYLNCKKDYVDLGFWHAAHLTLHADKMHTEGRKYMKSLRYSTLDEIDEIVLEEVLQEAYSVKDRGFYS